VTKRKAPPNTFRERPQDINRKGRPRVGLTFAERVRAVLEEETEDGKKTLIEQMVDIAIKRAKSGSFQFYDALIARAYGKVPDKVEVAQEQPFDPSKLNDAELDLLKQLLEKAKP
jgi:hypothetical protein